MPEPKDYIVSITDVVWAGKPSQVLFRTPEGQSVVFTRGGRESQKLTLSDERVQEIRGKGYSVEPVKPPKQDEPKPPKKGDKPEGKE